MVLPISALYGALLTALFCALGARVGVGRMKRVDEELLHRWVRAHGNLAENAPLFVLGLALVEAAGGSVLGLHLCGAAFVLARVSHAAGVSQVYGPTHKRRLGIITTWTLLGVVWTWAVLQTWRLLPTG